MKDIEKNNVEAKRKVEEAKTMSNFKWGQDFDRSYEKNKKKFWKEVRRVRKGGLRTEENKRCKWTVFKRK